LVIEVILRVNNFQLFLEQGNEAVLKFIEEFFICGVFERALL